MRSRDREMVREGLMRVGRVLYQHIVPTYIVAHNCVLL